MQLSSTLSWLVDKAAETAAIDQFLAKLGAHLIEDGLPLAGGALTLDVPHPLIALRTLLWRAESGEVIEALGFVPGKHSVASEARPSNDRGRRWLTGIAAGLVHHDAIGARRDGPSLSWIGPRQFTPSEIDVLRQAARFGMAHLDQERRRQGLSSLPFGVALHLGEMLWGNIGAADRLDFTAIGSAVNLVSRLEGLCRPLGKAVLVSGALAAETDEPLIALGTQDLRGIASPCAVFALPES